MMMCTAGRILQRFRLTPGGVVGFISSSLAGRLEKWQALTMLHAVAWLACGMWAGSRFESGVRFADDVGFTTTTIIRL